jgi:type IV fimbrial biogenesis protein FimT
MNHSGFPPPTAGPARGFTLLELMVVVAIAAILMAISASSFQSLTQSNRTLAESSLLSGAIKLARAEALKRGLPVALCASSDGRTCSGASAWQAGWLVFVDVNGNKAIDDGDTPLRVQRAFAGGDTAVASGGTSAMAFSRDGFALNQANAETWTFKTAVTNTYATRCLVMRAVVGSLQELRYNESTYNGSTCQ